MKTTLNILYQSNNYYAPITGVSMTSLMETNKDIDDINFFVLDDEISTENKKKMQQVCSHYNRNLQFIDTKHILKTLKDLKVAPFKNTYTTYFKLMALNDLPIKNSRILQLDGDTIINGSLKDLCSYDIDGYICAATYDCTMNSYKSLIDIPLNDKYYNCGVLLINQKKWIKDKCQQQIVNHLANVRNGYYTVDQDIINVLFRHEIKYLDLKYNFNSGFYIYGIKESFNMYNLKPEYYNTVKQVEKAYESPVLYHCMGAMTGRPWEQDSIHPQNELFDQYLKISPWKNFKKVKVHRKLIFKTQRMLYIILPRRLYIPLHKIGQLNYLKNMNKAAQDQRNK